MKIRNPLWYEENTQEFLRSAQGMKCSLVQEQDHKSYMCTERNCNHLRFRRDLPNKGGEEDARTSNVYVYHSNHSECCESSCIFSGKEFPTGHLRRGWICRKTICIFALLLSWEKLSLFASESDKKGIMCFLLFFLFVERLITTYVMLEPG